MPTYYHLDQSAGEPVDADCFEWIVTDYRYESYEGSGYAVGLAKDGLLYEDNIGHCSCYGPFEKFSGDAVPLLSGRGQTPAEYLADIDDAIGETPRLKRKVAELLGVVELRPA